jgi:hypothetical protein
LIYVMHGKKPSFPTALVAWLGYCPMVGHPFLVSAIVAGFASLKRVRR